VSTDNGDIKKFAPFELKVSGSFSLAHEGDQVRLTAHFDIPSWPGGGKPPAISIACPINYFTDREQILQWAGSTARQFGLSPAETFLSDARLHLRSIAGWYLNQLGVEEVSLKDLVEAHARDSAANLKRQLDMRRGQASPWTRLELAQAVNRAIRKMPRTERSLEAVAAILRESHPEIAPPTGEALRKLLGRFELKWGEMKKQKRTVS
jgi:hypothetical protein